MNQRQFLALFLCSLIPWWVGSGLLPLLPIYAARLGASPAVVGNYLSFVFLALAIGTMLGGWLSGKVQNLRGLLMGLGIASVPATLIMGQVSTIGQLVILNATLWFGMGVTLAVVTIVAGASAEQGKHGRVFGLLAATSSLGGVLGGSTGFIADSWGYAWLFALVSCAWCVQIAAAAALVNPPHRTNAPQNVKPDPPQEGATPRGTTFLLLLVAALLFSTGGFAGTLGRSLAMEAQGFDNSTITLLAALGAMIGLVVTPLLGGLSDRVGRRWLLCLVYVTGALALVMMAYSRTSLDFLVVAALTALSGAERAISSALVSDLLPLHARSRGLSLLDSVKWLGGVVGLAGTGYVIQQLGLSHALLVSALLPASAIALLLVLRLQPRPALQLPAAHSASILPEAEAIRP